jgi:hypothetical protein
MIVLLDIKDNKAEFVMELLKNLSFVKAETLSPYKKKVLKSVRQGIKEMKMIEAGQLKGIPAKKLLDEL